MGTGLSFRSSPQFVKLGDKTSAIILTKTGAPQGTVLTPFLFPLYTADYRHNQKTSCCIQMFSDDTALVGLINQGNCVDYRREKLFVTWCDGNFLKLNLEKTKELIVDFRRNKEVTIKGQQVEIVQSYKYLGAHLDSKLNRKRNCDAVFKKTQSR